MSPDKRDEFLAAYKDLTERARKIMADRARIYGYKRADIESIEFDDSGCTIRYEKFTHCTACVETDFEYISWDELAGDESTESA